MNYVKNRPQNYYDEHALIADEIVVAYIKHEISLAHLSDIIAELLRKSKTAKVTCPRCRGTMYADYLNSIFCGECGGSGWVYSGEVSNA